MTEGQDENNFLQCKTEAEGHSPATWSHPDSSEHVTADRKSGIKMRDHEMSKSRIPRIYVSFQRRASQISLTFKANLLKEWCRMQAQEFLHCNFSNCTSSKIHPIERCFAQNLHTSSGLFCRVITCYKPWTTNTKFGTYPFTGSEDWMRRKNGLIKLGARLLFD